MPFDPYIEKALLDWTTGAAAVTAPSGRWIQWATASPTSQSPFDGPFSPRFTVTFAGANSPQGSVTNLNAITGTATAAATAVGWNLYNSSVGGSRLAYGTLSAIVGCKSADNPAFGAGGLIITLS
jgi:hypothetical protein